MTFSICIPNYNYDQFLGATIESVLAQHHGDLELHISDNASTDASVDVVRSFDDPRISLSQNRCNVGFAANLDRAVAGTTGDRIILLSSDDLMAPTALAVYDETLRNLDKPDSTIISATCQVIDGTGEPIGMLGPPTWCWQKKDVDGDLSRAIGRIAYRLTPEQVLERSLRQMRNPLWFASTCYPRSLYRAVEGYRGQHLIGPDKEFHWRLVAAADSVVFIDSPLFSYRVHSSNQNSQQSRVGALKFLVDQYTLSFNTDPQVRSTGNTTSEELAQSFVREDIAKRSVLALVTGDPVLAQRTIAFGMATYPKLMSSDPLAVVARALVAGRLATSPLLRRFERRARSSILAQSVLVKEGSPGVPT